MKQENVRSGRFRPKLVIMVKAPVAGAVKTRLAQSVGGTAATSFYRHVAARVISRLSKETRWETCLAIAPDNAIRAPIWPQAIAKQPQGTGDLGSRMQRVFDLAPPGPVVIIGTDIPEIRPRHIADAFKSLGNHDAVFGPADDGGYWLVGLKRFPMIISIFANVRWSSEYTLRDTLANLEGRSVAMLGTLDDVDEMSSYRRLSGASGRLVLR